jgi:hypothetical protein
MNIPVFSLLTGLACAVLVASCATSNDTKSTEALVIAAGFKVIKPVKPDQKVMLEKLSENKLTRINHKDKTYYILPDRADGQAYVGGPKQYQSYQQLSQAKNVALEADGGVTSYEREQTAAANWGGWDGWDGTDGWSSEDGQTN